MPVLCNFLLHLLGRKKKKNVVQIIEETLTEITLTYTLFSLAGFEGGIWGKRGRDAQLALIK